MGGMGSVILWWTERNSLAAVMCTLQCALIGQPVAESVDQRAEEAPPLWRRAVGRSTVMEAAGTALAARSV
jgi:hypothetical protein